MRSRRHALAITVLAVSSIAGCATPTPNREVRMVARAFDALNSASQPLLDDLALAERDQGRRVAERLARERANPRSTEDAKKASAQLHPACRTIDLVSRADAAEPAFQNGFCPDHSPYYSDLADPPATARFRRSLAALGDYTHLLVILAENRNLDEANAQIQMIAGNVGTTLELAGVGGGLVLEPVAAALRPLIDLAGKRANAEELRRLVVQDAPKVRTAAQKLRDFAPEMFRTIVEVPVRRFRIEGATNAEVARIEAARINAYRTVISNYVVLLDQYQDLLADLAGAYVSPNAGGRLAVLAERSSQLTAGADAWRRSLASLRTALP